MKKSDIITVSFIAVLGLIASFFACRAIVGDPDQEKVKVTTIEVVKKDVADPSDDTFNAQALNPTVEVFVGDTSKQTSNASQNTGNDNSGE